MISRAFARHGLAARIGAAIVAAVIAIQVLVTLVFVLNSRTFTRSIAPAGSAPKSPKSSRMPWRPKRRRRALWGISEIPTARHWYGACAAAPP